MTRMIFFFHIILDYNYLTLFYNQAALKTHSLG